MKIENQSISFKAVSIPYEDYLQYCRDKFGIVESANGVDEIQAIIESVSMNGPSVLTDRNIKNIEVRGQVTKNLVQMYRDAANYLELLQAHVELLEKERKDKEYREHAESLIGH